MSASIGQAGRGSGKAAWKASESALYAASGVRQHASGTCMGTFTPCMCDVLPRPQLQLPAGKKHEHVSVRLRLSSC